MCYILITREPFYFPLLILFQRPNLRNCELMSHKEYNRISFVLFTLSLFLIIFLAGCTQSEDGPNSFQISIINFDRSKVNITFSELTELDSVTGTSSFENRFGNVGGKGTYTGVNISSIFEYCGIIFLPSDLLIVKASDGYEAIYNYHNIYPNSTFYNLQGSMALAYSFDGIDIPQWDKGPQIVFFPPDGLYSNEDKGSTSSLEMVGSAGSRWISNVVSLELIRESETLSIYHNKNYTLSYSQLKFLPKVTGSGGYIKTTGAIEGPFTFEGVDLVKTFDLFLNTSEDFSIEVIATDGYKMSYTKEQVFGKVPIYNTEGNQIGYGAYGTNLSLVLAYNEDGSPLEHGGPFRMVYLGEDVITDGHFWTKYVKTINFIPSITE